MLTEVDFFFFGLGAVVVDGMLKTLRDDVKVFNKRLVNEIASRRGQARSDL